jgi:hypothetical protein
MGFRKTHDLAVRTGTYTGSDGKEKGRYENVGHVLTGDDGGKLYCLKRTFNPAGVANPENRDTVVLSVFEVREHGDTQPARSSRPVESYPGTPAPAPQSAGGGGGAPFDDDIPFMPHEYRSLA